MGPVPLGPAGDAGLWLSARSSDCGHRSVGRAQDRRGSATCRPRYRPGPYARRVSAFWSTFFRVFYRVLTRLGPLIRVWVARVGLGNVVELVVSGRRTGRRRVVLLGLLRVDRHWYLGHPNGQASWTRNLDAAGDATLLLTHHAPIEVRPELLPTGEERRRVIAATWRQHVFPGNVIYWLARRHIFAVGRYYRIQPVGSGRTASTTGPGPGVDPAADESPRPYERISGKTPKVTRAR